MVRSKIFGDTGMRTRALVRKQGWIPVDVDALKLKSNTPYQQNDDDNANHYKEILEWCNRFVGKGNYLGVMQYGSERHNVKRFIFKNPKHATMFRLKWLTS